MKYDSEVLVSVIIPNYNHARFLRQRLESVLKQTIRQFEVIILDDCSTDDSRIVIESFRGHEKISHIIFGEKNSGSPFLQWNKGIQLAKGNWIWIAESDDWCEPIFLNELTSKIKDDVSLAFCQTVVINQEEKKIWQTKWRKSEEEFDGDVFIKDFLSKGNYIVNASMCIFQKKIYQQISGTFTKFKFIGDWVLWLELAALGKVVVSGKQLNYFRKHDRDVSGKAFTEGLGYYEVFSFLDGLDVNKLIQKKERMELYTLRFFEFLNDKKVDKKHRDDIYSLFRKRLGSRMIYLQFKNWVVKKIKTPILGKRKAKMRLSENFSSAE